MRAEVRDEISQCIQPLLARLSWVEAQIGAMSHEPRDDDSLLEESQKEPPRVMQKILKVGVIRCEYNTEKQHR